MNAATAIARPVRLGAAAASVVGIIGLAGCAATTAPPANDAAKNTSAVSATPGSAAAGSTYKDGTYTADGSYSTPESIETINVTVTLKGDVVTAVTVTGHPTKRESVQYQGEFIGGISGEVVGKKIESLSVSRVAGSSLTSTGFNQAINTIKTEAAAAS